MYIISFFVMFSFFLHSSSNATNIIPDTCKEISKDDPDVTYGFCLRALGSNPRNSESKTTLTTIDQLGSISFKLGISKAIATKSRIENLLKDPHTDPRNTRVLKLFLEQYLDALMDLEGGIKALRVKDYLEANNRATSATISALTCKDDRKAKKRIPGLYKENDDFFQLNSISISITNMLFERDHGKMTF
ncbi:putative invertase inhibitor [Spinacia oleracea]|uniref:Invertase inhibitor n=1 Tax=Spinacia oleracea TaxID=3562 RepID=A0A9R0J679_SPIOL|nr:putative invertase inhibitor [Spinacia oleracea]